MENHKCLGPGVSTIWENTDGCDEFYRCATALYALSILSQSYNIVIESGIIAPGHGIEVVDGLNATYKG